MQWVDLSDLVSHLRHHRLRVVGSEWRDDGVVVWVKGEGDDTPMHEVSQTERAPADRQGG